MINDISVLKIEATTYDDCSIWIEFFDRNTGLYSYEISYEYTSDSIEEINNDLINGSIKLDQESFKNSIDLFNKKELSSCSEDLRDLIESCYQSENEMWFVEYDDIELVDYNLIALMEEVEDLKLSNYFEFDNGDAYITVFGGVITEFLF